MTGMALERTVEDTDDTTTHAIGRLGLIRKLVVFQVKLAADGLRDLVLSPLSLVAGIIGILFGGKDPAWAYRRLMVIGLASDRWINLFDAYGPNPVATTDAAATDARTLDAMIDDLEEHLRRDYAEGGMTARTRSAIEDRLMALRAELERRHAARQEARDPRRNGPDCRSRQ